MITKMLGLTTVRPEELEAEIEAYCFDGWRPRDELVAHRGAMAGRTREPASPA